MSNQFDIRPSQTSDSSAPSFAEQTPLEGYGPTEPTFEPALETSLPIEESSVSNNAFTDFPTATVTSEPFGDATNASTLPPPSKKRENWLAFGLKMLVLAVAVFVLTQLVVPPYVVKGQSMEPNFHTGERVLTDRAVFKLFGSPKRDDVVILNEPDNNEVLIKRVIGLPGDTVEVSNGNVYINGKALDEPFIQFKTNYTFGPQVVPPRNYFVMGDNRSNSLDSHLFGFVADDKIIARVMFKLF